MVFHEVLVRSGDEIRTISLMSQKSTASFQTKGKMSFSYLEMIIDSQIYMTLHSKRIKMGSELV